jgi:hypothetical protein
MSLAELISKINAFRQNVGQPAIEINTRPSSSGNGTTIEILGGGVVLSKSINGGAINWFLKGMLTAFQNQTAPSISNFQTDLFRYRRAIDLS